MMWHDGKIHFIAHHACGPDNGYEYIRENAPFLSTTGTRGGVSPFLGDGYYFWDDNFELAKSWGKKRYRRRDHFYILEATISSAPDEILDLVGSRQDMQFIVQAVKMFESELLMDGEIGLSQVINLLKSKESEDGFKGIFPFKLIRAIDVSKKRIEQNPIKFVKENKSFALLSPQIIICLLIKNSTILRTDELTKHQN